MWRPTGWEDVERAIGTLEEAPDLDFKKEVSSNREISKDVAAMILLGGVLVYGIEADDQERAVKITKVPLLGLPEKIQSIVSTTIAPIPAIEFNIQRGNTSDADGVLIVTVPRSLMCPHMAHGRFPARATTTTRDLTELEMAALYEQRREVLSASDDSEILSAFVESAQEIPSKVGVGRMRLSVVPFGSPRHPAGTWLKAPLEKAATESLPILDGVVMQKMTASTRDRFREWDARGTMGWQTGWIGDPFGPGGDSTVFSAATFTHDLRLSFVTVMRLDAPGGRVAYEQIWAVEVVRTIAFASSFLSEVPGVTMLRLDLGLQGVDGSVSSASSHGHAFSPSQTMVTDADYRERVEAGTHECADDPRSPARDLLDRLFASFLSESQDPFTRIAP
jgi:hypothetical protein